MGLSFPRTLGLSAGGLGASCRSGSACQSTIRLHARIGRVLRDGAWYTPPIGDVHKYGRVGAAVLAVLRIVRDPRGKGRPRLERDRSDAVEQAGKVHVWRVARRDTDRHTSLFVGPDIACLIPQFSARIK